ncbi:MAG: tetratricopeptide repeat protein, partial [Hymenobacteraceae bacterium]|nr:tetratricopeptide repeat protein [Hymenobacteraceae bacterium]MDX5396961.1 tetratricopeptide repeat protein [Hymenobacteraceae bacterium]MDX5443521.1 tetratricopeptide repeat protein [Hymenobacteraceae bacterium]MDX5513035.1 tetratricopeptide repeat protein [Hymenobacteraceae bacterium]
MHKTKFIFFVMLYLLMATATPGYSQFWKKKKEADKKETSSATPAAPPVSQKDLEASEAFYLDGLRYFMLEEYTKALERLTRASALNPHNAAIHYKLAETQVYLGKPTEAFTHSKKALELDPKNPYYYLLLAQLHTELKQYAEAAQAYNDLMRNVPDTEQYLFSLADLY